MITSIESSSPLSHDFIGHLMQYMPNNSGFSYLKAAVKKNNDISSIKLEDTDKISGEFKQRLNKIIQNAKEGNVFEIKKVPVQYRKFIKNWLALESKFSPKVFNKNILLVDDYLTSGTSMYAAYEILKSNGAKNVYALSLVKLWFPIFYKKNWFFAENIYNKACTSQKVMLCLYQQKNNAGTFCRLLNAYFTCEDKPVIFYLLNCMY